MDIKEGVYGGGREMKMMQVIVLILADGRKVRFTGPAEIKEGDVLKDICFGAPQPLPEGCSWENLTGVKK